MLFKLRVLVKGLFSQEKKRLEAQWSLFFLLINQSFLRFLRDYSKEVVYENM